MRKAWEKQVAQTYVLRGTPAEPPRNPPEPPRNPLQNCAEPPAEPPVCFHTPLGRRKRARTFLPNRWATGSRFGRSRLDAVRVGCFLRRKLRSFIRAAFQWSARNGWGKLFPSNLWPLHVFEECKRRLSSWAAATPPEGQSTWSLVEAQGVALRGARKNLKSS